MCAHTCTRADRHADSLTDGRRKYVATCDVYILYIYIYTHTCAHTHCAIARTGCGGRDLCVPSPRPEPKKTHPRDVMIPSSAWSRRISFDPAGGGQTRNAKGVKRDTLSRPTPRPGVKRGANARVRRERQPKTRPCKQRGRSVKSRGVGPVATA